MKLIPKYLWLYIISVFKRWKITVLSILFFVNLILFYYDHSIIPYNYSIFVLIVLFAIANFLVFSEKMEEIEFLYGSRDLGHIYKLILLELRNMAPEVGYTPRRELNQEIFDISVYWDINGVRNTEIIGYIYLLSDYGNITLEFDENKYHKNVSGRTIQEIKEKLMNNLELANLIKI